MDRQLKSRVLTAADIMTAYTNLAYSLRSLENSVGEASTATHAAFVAGQLVGAERLMQEEFKLLVGEEEPTDEDLEAIAKADAEDPEDTITLNEYKAKRGE